MGTLVIERASGARLEIELDQGVEIPPIQPGDKVRLILTDGQSVRPQIVGGDVVIALPVPTGAPEETIVLEDFALYLGDDETQLTIVDAESGDAVEFSDAGDVIGDIAPADGQPQPGPPEETLQSSSLRPTSLRGSDANVELGDVETLDRPTESLLQQILPSETVTGQALARAEVDDGVVALVRFESATTDKDTTASPTTVDAVVTITGQAIDGYIVGATVFRDTDGDGVEDADEVFTTTGADGLFTIAAGDGPLILTGGTDVSTGLAFQGTLTAPSGATVVTPLTTLMQSMIEDGLAADATAAEQAVKAAFSLSDDIDLTAFDPVDGVLNGVSGADAVMAAGIKVQDTVVQTAGVLEGAGASTAVTGTISSAVYSNLASDIVGAGGAYDLDSATNLEVLIEDVVDDASLGLDETSQTYVLLAAADSASIIADGNSHISGLTTEGSVLLTDLAQAAYISQNAAAQSLNDALSAVEASGNVDDLTSGLNTAKSEYSGTALDTKINTAEVGDVDGATIGTSANETLTGAGVADVIEGGAGADILIGGGGDDRLIGGLGDDTLTGGAGNDDLTGGDGNDTFVISPGEQTDVVADFQAGDVIDMTGFVAAGTTPVLKQAGADTQITNSDGSTVFVTVRNVAASDLWLDANTGLVRSNATPVAETAAITADEDRIVTGTLSGSDTDSGDALAFALVSGSSAGTLTIAQDGTYTFDPGTAFQGLGADESQPLSFTYSVSDSKVTVTKIATLTVAGQNDAPVAVAATATTAEQTSVTGQLQANDDDTNDSLTFALVSAPAKGTLTLGSDGIFTYDPGTVFDSLATGETEAVSFTYSVSDGNGGTDTESVTITVSGSNAAPVIQSVVSLTTDEDSTLTGTLAGTVSDSDANDTLAFALVSGPQGLSIASDGSYSFDPGTSFQNLDTGESTLLTFTYSVSDGDVTVQRSATLTVTGNNDAPQGITTSIQAGEDASVTGTLAASDTDVESLTYAVATAPTKGTLTISANGFYTFNPGTAFDTLAAGETEAVTFQYSVSDGTATTSQSATITVTGANDAPVTSAATVTRTAIEDGLSTGTLPGSDVDNGASLTFAIVSQPARGALTVTNAATGAFSFDPGTAFQGLDAGESVELSFVYSVTDGTATVQKTAALIVTGANDAPVAVTTAVTGADEDVAISGQLVATDVDVEAAGLTFTLKTAPNVGGTPQGDLVVSSDGTFTFTADSSLQNLNEGESRILSFEYTVSDGAISVDKTATITVAGHNDGPVVALAIADQTTNEDAAYSYDASTNFSDADLGDTLSYSATLAGGGALPAWLSINTATGVLSGTPANGDVGAISVTVTASDGDASVSDTFDLTIANTNDGPTDFSLVDASDSTIDVDEIVEKGTVIGKLQDVTDVDSGDTFTFSLVDDAGGRFALNTDRNEIVVRNGATFDAGTEPTVSIVVRVTDSAGASHDETFNISVNNVINGHATDGYLSGATVFRDADNDGVHDVGVEASATTDVEGNFSLVGGTGNIVMIGGTDVSTNLAFDGVMIAPEDASVLTPLTSLIAKMVANGDAANDAAAETAVTAAMGITSPTETLLHFDPVKESAEGTAGAIEIMATGVTVQNSIDIITSAVNGAMGIASPTAAQTRTAMNAAFSAMAGEIADGAAFQGLDSDAEVEAIIAAVANDTHVTGSAQLNLTAGQIQLLQDASAEIADIVVAFATKIDTIVADNGSDATGTLEQIAKTAIIAQSDAADDIRDVLATGSSDLSTLVSPVTGYTGARLDTRVDLAVAGDVNGNDAPVVNASSLTATLGEDAAFSGQLVATDADPANLTALTYTAETLPTKGTLSITASTGAYTYTPGADLQSLGAGESTTDSFAFTVSDGLASVTETVQLTINGANDAPVAVTAAIKGDEDTILSGELAATDVDTNASLTFAIVSQPANGVATITNPSTGAYTFDANGDFEGLDAGETTTVQFVYSVTDGQIATPVQKTVTVTVTGHNDAPVGVTTSVSATETGVTTGTLVGNDVDEEGLTYAIVSPPGEGTLTLTNTSTGAFSFDPGSDFTDLGAGETRDLNFTYSVSDGTLTVQKVATLTVTGDNDAPVAVTSAIAAREDDAISGTLIATDADSDTLTFTIDTPLTSGTGSLTLESDGDFTYDPNGAFESLGEGETNSTPVTFSYQVSDGHGGSDTRQVTITVTGANDGPAAAVETVASGESGVVSGQLDATDDDGDSLTFALQTAPAKGSLTVNPNGSYSFDPNSDFDDLGNGDTEEVNFVYTVTDGKVTTAQTGVITVTGVNLAPVPVTSNIDTGEDSGPISGTLVATDADSSSLSFALESSSILSQDGTLTLDPSGTYSFVPGSGLQSLSNGDSRTLDFVYSVTDGDTKVNQAATITVTGSNDGPVATVDTAGATENGLDVSIDVLANDTDVDTGDNDPSTLRVVAASAASGATVAFTGAVGAGLTYSPGSVTTFESLGAGETTTDTITYTIQDALGAQSQSTVTVTVTGTNDGPVAVTTAVTGADEDASLTGQLTATDADDGAAGLTFSLKTPPNLGGVPQGTMVVNPNGTFTFTPDNNLQTLDDGETRTLSFEYSVSDGTISVDQAATITVTGHNDAPVPETTTLATAENATLTGTLAASDVDGETLIFAAAIAPDKGTLTVNANGGLSYDPGTAFDSLSAGQSEAVKFTYTVSDGTITVPRQVSLTVTGQNDAPVAITAAVSAVEDSSVTGKLVATDVDTGATLTFALVTAPSAGSLSIGGDGTYTFNPAGAFESLAQGATQAVDFTYSVTDGIQTVQKVTTITVVGTNDGPVALPESASTTDGTPVSGQLDATDVDGDSLTFTLVSGTALGTITVASDGSYTFDPGSDFVFLGEGQTQAVTFSYSVTDGAVTATQTGTVTVSGGNDVPVAVTSAVSANEDGAVTGTLVATDGDNEPLTFSLVTPPSAGSLSINSNGAYAFDPGDAFDTLAVGETQDVTFTYRVTDGIAPVDKQATITVTGANDAPVVAAAVTAAAGEDNALTVDLLTGASDVDASDTLTVSNLTLISGNGSGVALNGNSLQINAGADNSLAVGASEVITYSYNVVDGNGGSVGQTVTLTVTGANDGPVATADTNAAFKGDTLSVSAAAGVLANDTDPDTADILTVTSFDATSTLGATVTVAADGRFAYDPSASTTLAALAGGSTVEDTFNYTFNDGNGGTATSTVTVTVSGSPTLGRSIVLGEDGVIRVDADGLSVSDLDLSVFNAGIEMQSLGTLTRILTNDSRSLEIDGVDLDAVSQADGTLKIAGNGAVDVVNAGLQTFTDGTAPTVLNLLALEFEGLDASKSIVPDRLTVGGSHTDAIASFWIQLDQLYVGAGNYYDLGINTSFVYLGNDYVRYLNAGGAPLMSIVKVPTARAQALHDNLLGNLGDSPIASRFTNLGEPDPRTTDGAAFGDRPYHAGSIADGVYSNVNALSGVMGWDIAHGIDYPDSLPSFYGVIDGANTITGGTSDDHLFGGAGNDTIDAGAGSDSVAYEGSQLDYTVSTDATSLAVSVADSNVADGNDGTDALTNTETLQFNDGTLRFEGQLAHAVPENDGGGTDGFHPGTGLVDTNFLISDNTDVGVEAGLKIHNRYAGDVATDSTIYHTNIGLSSGSAGLWNFNYSVILYQGRPLSDFDVVVTADFIDLKGNRTEDIMVYDAVLHEKLVADAGKPEAYYNDPTGVTEGLQNSQNIGWYATGYDADAPGSYEVTLTVTDKTTSNTVTSTTATVDVAGDITVAADGSGDYLTIQEAVNAASAGDTIVVKAGTYAPFGTTISGPADLKILAADGAVIEAATIADVPPVGRIVDLRADGTVLDGFTINGPGGDAGTSVGVSIVGQGVTVTNNAISDVLTGIQTNTEYATGNNTITDNTVSSNYGISLQNTDNTVTGNDVTAAVEGLGILAGVNTLSGNSFTVDTGGQALGLYLGAVASTLATSDNTVTVGVGDNLTNAVALAGDNGTLNVGDGDYTGGLDGVVGAENVTVTGGAGATGLDFELDTGVLDLSFSGAANVSITGNGSNNTLRGGTGGDTLLGGAGADTLIGGSGNDTLTGGDGNDTFVFGKNDSGTTRITDFTTGDVLDFTDVLDGGPSTDLQFSDVGGNTEVRSANDGFATVIAVVETVAAASMSLDSDGNVTISDAV